MSDTTQPPPPQTAAAFENLDADQQATEIESYCVNCEKNGITRLLLTKIPHFKEVIVMAFECPHCGLRNNEIQSGSAIQELGCRYICQIRDSKDMNRQVVKAESSSIAIKELDFESPPAPRGSLTTVEGLLQHIYDDIAADQPNRQIMNPELYEQLEGFLSKIQDCIQLKAPFTLSLDDPAGNSYVENLCAPQPDPQLAIAHYKRSPLQNVALGLPAEEQDTIVPAAGSEIHTASELDDVMEFSTNCTSCNAPCMCRMHMLDIPYFKEVVVMATSCDRCGYRSNEIRSGGAIQPKGKRITLKMTDKDDLSRDVLKSESCGLKIPEIDLELEYGSLGGRFTTVEGLLQQIHDELSDKAPFVQGDSGTAESRDRFDNFLNNLSKVAAGEILGTLILDDPLGNSYLQNLYAPDPDPNMTIEEYERTYEENDMFGLNDMKTEGYEEDA